MKKLNLVLGIVSLLIAAGLVIANLTLPASSLMFDIGYGNMSWVPPIIFGIVGIVLLATAGMGREEAATPGQEPKPTAVIDLEKAALNKRFETIGWGCFLILWAGSMFWKTAMPNTPLPDGLWSIGVGLIFLGLNLARYLNKIRMSGFTTFLGVLSVLGGAVQLLGVHGMEAAFLLLILGAYLVLKPWFDKNKMFGKAEEN